MKWFADRRQGDRRNEEPKGKEDIAQQPQQESPEQEPQQQQEQQAETQERRGQGDRRQTQRREFFRVVYPPAAAPEVSNLSARVMDISLKSVKFALSEKCPVNKDFDASSKIDMVFVFHNGQKIESMGTVLRQETGEKGKKLVICVFDKEIPAEVINNEQAYLLKCFPDFCRKMFKF